MQEHQLIEHPPAIFQHQFIWLFAALIGFLLLVPGLQYLHDEYDSGIPLFVEACLFITLLAMVVLSITRSRAWRILTIALALPAALLWVVPAAEISDAVRVVRHLLAILFLAYGITSILLLIFATRQINLNVLFASLCVYLLLGVIWAISYSAIETVNPGAFYCSLPEGRFPTNLHMDSGSSSETLYFSFTTLTTLGYGDIMPTSRLTRLMAALEALIGQLYLTVLVARLVGLHIADLDDRTRSDA